MSTVENRSAPSCRLRSCWSSRRSSSGFQKELRDPEAMRLAAEEMDLACEELRERSGELNVAVDLVRESPDGPSELRARIACTSSWRSGSGASS